jgi:hypothetical protein
VGGLRRLALVVGAAAVLAAAAGLTLAANKPWRPAHGPKTFSISGQVADLAPGHNSILSLKVRNPWSRTIRVTSITARVDPSGRACPVRNVRVGPFRGSLVIPPRSVKTVMLEAVLRKTAAHACAGAAFPLRFFGRAVVR